MSFDFFGTHPKEGEILVEVVRDGCGCRTEHYSEGTQVSYICRGHGGRTFVVPPVHDLPGLEFLRSE